MRLKATLVFLLFVGLPLAAASIPEAAKPEEVGLSSERLRRIHEAIQSHIDLHEISGAVTLVARKGRIAHFEAHGWMDLESKKPMTKDSIFRIWSMSKPVGGVAIMMLLEEGKVRLNDPVSKFIPEFKGMKVAEDRLADYTPKLGATPLDFQPGSRWSYSAAAAFDTLARVVEVASGQAVDQFLRQRIFDPLGMKDTFFSPTEERWPRVPVAYHRSGEVLQKVENPNRMVSTTYFGLGGGLMASTLDYAQFAEMLVEGGQLNGNRLLSPKTVELMSSAFVPDTLPGRAPGIGYGLSVQVVTNPIAAGYRVSPGTFGWDGAYGTHFWVDPKEKTIGVMMIQTDNPDRRLDRDFENAVMQAIVD